MTRPALPFLPSRHDPFSALWLEALRAAMPDERIVRLDELDATARQACDVAIVANPDPADVAALPGLKWMHSVWAGVERLMAELPADAPPVVRLVDPELSRSMAEAVLAWTLYLHRDMPRYAAQQAARQWQGHDYVPPSEKTVGILGLGTLGIDAAHRLRDADFRVTGWSRQAKSIEGIRCESGDAGLKTVLADSDIVVCLLPLTAQTRGLVDAQALAAMRAGAGLINFARGPIVDDAALHDALDRGHLSHAVLDVFAQEPLPAQAWQWGHARVTVLPHISAPTNRRTASAIVAERLRAYRSTGAIPAAVDRVRGY